jgi:hypothetical protein
MKLLSIQNRIAELMTIFTTQIRAATAMRRTDINHVSETILVPLFAEVYGYKNLKNLNFTESDNYPGIDIGDEVAKVAFQITSTTKSDKIKSTLRSFVEHELYKKYDRLIVYILTEKQSTYSGRGYEKIIQGRFLFNKDTDIWDYRDVLKSVVPFQIDKAKKIQHILEANFGDGSEPLIQEVSEPRTETEYLNLLEIFFPESLYIADLAIERAKIIANSQSGSYKNRLRNDCSTREVVRAALEQHGLRFGVDWECSSNHILTFHNLCNTNIPLRQVVDETTIRVLSPKEFYEGDENHARLLKTLLGRCMQQKLYHQQILWQNEAKLFIFAEEDGFPVRREEWYGKKVGNRKVYERIMKKNKPDEILYCKHLAFQTHYKSYSDNWYVMIVPQWFMSYDGYKRSLYGADKISYLKRKEKNQHVFNHLRFIVYMLSHDKPSTLFKRRYPYPFLSFGQLLSFDSAPFLDDPEWRAGESKEERKKLEDAEGTLPFPIEEP